MKLSRELWLEVEPLLTVALDLPEDDRDGWLAAVDTAHPQAAAVLRRMLATHARAERVRQLETVTSFASAAGLDWRRGAPGRHHSGMPIRFRPLVPSDQAVLWDIFHIALWDPPPAPLRPREILDHPDVRIYVEDWGQREGDVGVVAEVDGKVAGACWMRLVKGGKGLSYLDDETPQLGIGLLPEYQRQGYGEPLMRAALEAGCRRFRRIALSVHPENPAQRLYRRCGFEQVDVRRTYLIMVRDCAAK